LKRTKIKIIFVTRLFSGLIDSVESGEWNPFGVPAIYKLWEKLNNLNYSADILFLCKTRKDSRKFKKITKMNFPDLRFNFYIIPFFGTRRKVNNLSRLNEFIQCIYFIKRLLKEKYDLLYTDRIHLKFAFIGSIFKIPTVVRFLGIANFKLFTDSIKYRIRSPFNYLVLKKRYSMIICTEDGTPARHFFKKCLNKKTPFRILLNGVDRYDNRKRNIDIRNKYLFIKEVPIFLFVGRLEKDKGGDEFIQSLIKLKKIYRSFYAIMICGGSDFTKYKQKIKDFSLLDQIKFEKAVPHELIHEYFKQTDVYVSINKLGNLSNTVLEAIIHRKCIVMLNNDLDDHTDESTKAIIPENVVIRIDRKNIVSDLTIKLSDLIENPEIISMYAKRMRKFSADILWSWDERINYEIKLIKKIARQ
jgi:glycosyltransferase involved in cell wall biosynthesis|tara:strand:- start:1367 stop:2614 length:1248 start_codon:yes stop_codon:yes gene_type:complete